MRVIPLVQVNNAKARSEEMWFVWPRTGKLLGKNDLVDVAN